MPGRFCWNQPTRKPCLLSLQTWKKHLRSDISSQFKTPESSKNIAVKKKARPLSSDVHWHSHRSYQQTLTLMIWLLLSLTSWKFFAQLQSDHGSNWLHFFLAPKSSQPTSNTSNPLAQFSPGKGWMCVNGNYHNCLIFSLQFETWRSGSFLVLWYKSLHD